MIEVMLYETPHGEMCGFHISGHAGFADRGEDIVCAAVSVLVINTINSVEALTQAKFAGDVREDGEVSFRLTGERGGEDAVLLLQSLVLGLEGIQREYGDKFIQIETKRKQEG